MSVVPRRVLLLALLTHCASGPPLLLGRDAITKPVAVLVRISGEVEKTDQAGGTAALVDGVTAGLRERGVESVVYAGDHDQPAPPRVELWVMRWDEGGVGERVGSGLLNAVRGESAAAGGYSVTCRVFRAREVQASFERTFSGPIVGNDEPSEGTGASVGREIADAVLRGD